MKQKNIIKKSVLLIILLFSIIRCGSVMDMLDPVYEKIDPNRVATPVITPANGSTFYGTASVTITCSTAGSNIRYTTDGTNPSQTNGYDYLGYFNIYSTTTVKAIAYAADKTESYIATSVITYQRFVINHNATMTDNMTGKMWMQDGSVSGLLDWNGGNTYCNNLTLAGYTDWRLPSLIELQTLISSGTSPYNGWLQSMGFINMQPGYYWSSDPMPPDYFKVLYMDSGSVMDENQFNTNGRVLAVRP